MSDTGVEPDDAGDVEAAITNEKLLSKLCFLRFGTSFERGAPELQAELLSYRGGLKTSSISPTAITNWFTRGNAPRREAAIAFLLQYTSDKIEYRSLDPKRKQIYSKIARFLKKNSPKSNSPEKVRYTDNSSVVIELDIKFEDLVSAGSALSGLYELYKLRFSDETDEPVAREVLHVFLRHKELRFRLWYKKEKANIEQFSGVVIPTANIFWFVGTSSVGPDRFRIMYFRTTDAQSAMYNKFHWGIAASDIPYVPSQEPAAARVLLVPKPMVPDIHRYVNATVRHLKIADISPEISDVVSRMIDNHATAFSIPGTIKPHLDTNGQPARDLILKVDQRTLMSAMRTWVARTTISSPT